MDLQVFKKGEKRQLTKNFWQSEFECSCPHCKEVKIDMDHVRKLQKLRDDLDCPIIIESAYICEKCKEFKEDSDTYHSEGTATDITVSGMTQSEVADACESFNGLGRYDTFTHVDSRTDSNHRVRWDNRAKHEYLPTGPSDDDINVCLDELEDEILN